MGATRKQRQQVPDFGIHFRGVGDGRGNFGPQVLPIAEAEAVNLRLDRAHGGAEPERHFGLAAPLW